MQSDILEERYAIKFCFKLGGNATETYGMLQTAFGASCMTISNGVVMGLEELEIGQAETLQTTALLRLDTLLRRVLET